MATSGHLCQWAFVHVVQLPCVGAPGPWDPHKGERAGAPWGGGSLCSCRGRALVTSWQLPFPSFSMSHVSKSGPRASGSQTVVAGPMWPGRRRGAGPGGRAGGRGRQEGQRRNGRDRQRWGRRQRAGQQGRQSQGERLRPLGQLTEEDPPQLWEFLMQQGMGWNVLDL